MKKQKVYIESTIPSYIVSRLSRDILVLSHQKISKDWWNHTRKDYDLYISQVVIDEISAGDKELAKKRNSLIKSIPILEGSNKIDDLAKLYLKHFKFPERALRDAFHIAFAVYYEIDFLLTWNCTHLANANVRKELIRFNNRLKYKTPDICTPEELKNIMEG